jgi:hypothetical protein
MKQQKIEYSDLVIEVIGRYYRLIWNFTKMSATTNTQKKCKFYDAPVVHSVTGLRRYVCSANCTQVRCYNAHPNAAGSNVLHPKWCLRGSIETCELADCPFNHWRTMGQFVAYRARDPKWAAANGDLCTQYNDEVVFDELFRAQMS